MGESEAEKLIATRESTELVITEAADDALPELVGQEVVDQLGEDEAADMHASLSGTVESRPQQGQNRFWKPKSKRPG